MFSLSLPGETNSLVSPVVKWAGGKRQLLGDIKSNLPKEGEKSKVTYYEPFIGGGAVLFFLQPRKAVINDTNEELINLYRVVKNNPIELIEDLKKHINKEEYYYKIRSIDRNKNEYQKLSDVRRASRIIFLNKTCYNGLYRVNSMGEFNTPFGSYKNPDIVNEHKIWAVNKYFNDNEIKILNTDFEAALEDSSNGDFVYLDPPYDPVSESANFTSYTRNGFDRDDQIRLKNLCDKLDRKGVRFMLSNSSTDFIENLYSAYKISRINAKRHVNSRAEKRGEVKELLIKNY